MESSLPKYFTVATAGHVDHGKTSVLKALTGIDPDRLKEEKLRQMTTDLGFAHLTLRQGLNDKSDDVVVGFIDVPGHGKFLKNMLAGVGGIQMALLVVAADEGPMPQTISHVKILSLLGVRKAVVALTKIDIAPEPRRAEVCGKVQNLLETFGIECLRIVPVSCTEGRGFDDLKKAIGDALGQLEKLAPSASALLPIDRVFSKSGYGVVITGTLVRGTLKVGESVSIEPGGVKGRVRGLETFKKQLERAESGQRLAVNLSLKDHAQLGRGQVLANDALPVVNTILANIQQVGPRADWVHEKNLNDQPVRFYHGTAECYGHLRWCQALSHREIDRQLVVQIGLDDPAVVEPGDRFILRYGDEGITGGAVLMNARPRWLTRKKLGEFLDLLASGKVEAAGVYYLENSPQAAVTQDAFSCFVPDCQLDAVANDLVERAQARKIGDYLVSPRRADDLKDQAFEAVLAGCKTELIAAQPQVSIESIRANVAHGLDRHVFQQLVKELVDSGRLVRSGDKLMLEAQPSESAQASQAALGAAVLSKLEGVLCLEIEELAKLVGSDRKSVTAVLHALSERGQARIINYEFASSAQAVQSAHKALAKIFSAKREISPADFRDELATTRKYAMALLAYFDDNSVTRRTVNSRILLKAPRD